MSVESSHSKPNLDRPNHEPKSHRKYQNDYQSNSNNRYIRNWYLKSSSSYSQNVGMQALLE